MTNATEVELSCPNSVAREISLGILFFLLHRFGNLVINYS